MSHSDEDVRRIVRIAIEETSAQGISRADATAIAQEAAKATSAAIFKELGLDVKNAKDMKRQRADLEFLHAFHNGASRAGARAMFSLITIMIGGLALALWEGIKFALHMKGSS